MVLCQILKESRWDTEWHAIIVNFSILIRLYRRIKHLLVPLGSIEIQSQSLELIGNGLLPRAERHNEFRGYFYLVLNFA